MPLVIVNQLLQGQGKNAIESTGRFVVNTTAGVFGLIDVADKVGLEQKQEDFGQTLGAWGTQSGCYFVLPFLGPTTARDAVGLIGNVFIVGQLWKDFSIMKDDIITIQENQNVLTLKQEILELNYKIKSLRLEIDGDYRE